MYPDFSFAGEAKVIPFHNLNGVIANQFRITRNHAHVKNIYHQHDYFQIWYMEYGSCVHHLNGFDFSQSTGDMIIVPPYLGHYLNTSGSGNFELVCVEFSEHFIDSAAADINKSSLFNLIYLKPLLDYSQEGNPILHFDGLDADNITHVLNDLFDEYIRQDQFFTTLVRADMTKLLTFIVRQFESRRSMDGDRIFAQYRASIQEALRYIDENFTQKIYLNDVCKKALMSTSAFSSIFKNITGKTLVEYLNYLRVLRAKDLLIQTDKSVLEIGLDCGFRDAVNFSRVFKKITGHQPTTYRKIFTMGEPSSL